MSDPDHVYSIVQRGNAFEVHETKGESVWPVSTYPTKRLAASRLLQLLEIGPVSPQTYPETVEITTTREEF